MKRTIMHAALVASLATTPGQVTLGREFGAINLKNRTHSIQAELHVSHAAEESISTRATVNEESHGPLMHRSPPGHQPRPFHVEVDLGVTNLRAHADLFCPPQPDTEQTTGQGDHLPGDRRAVSAVDLEDHEIVAPHTPLFRWLGWAVAGGALCAAVPADPAVAIHAARRTNEATTRDRCVMGRASFEGAEAGRPVTIRQATAETAHRQ